MKHIKAYKLFENKENEPFIRFLTNLKYDDMVNLYNRDELVYIFSHYDLTDIENNRQISFDKVDNDNYDHVMKCYYLSWLFRKNRLDYIMIMHSLFDNTTQPSKKLYPEYFSKMIKDSKKIKDKRYRTQLISYLYYSIFLLGSFSYIKDFDIDTEYFQKLTSAGGFVHGIRDKTGIYLEENQKALFKLIKENIKDSGKVKFIGEYIGKVFRHIKESKYLNKKTGAQLRKAIIDFLSEEADVYQALFDYLSNTVKQDIATQQDQDKNLDFF